MTFATHPIRKRGRSAMPKEASSGAIGQKAIIPKYVGFEIELGSHPSGSPSETCVADVAKALVKAHHRHFQSGAGRSDDSGSEFDDRGFRFYLDHQHAEIASPLCASAVHLALTMRAARKAATRGMKAAAVELGPIRVSYNNTNRAGVAWAFHGNFLVARTAFDKWRENDWAPLRKQWLPFLVTSLPILGTGKVGAENGGRDTAFQFSQRADFIDGVTGLETVTSKSLINTRDEPLASPEKFARLHVIAFDTNLAEFANWLKFGISQLLLALIEEKAPMPDLALDSPVRAFHAVSRDLKLQKRLRLQNGRRQTALEVQRRLAEAAARAIEAGCAACQVPDAELIIEKWIETLDDLDARRPRLNRRLDWCAKLGLIHRAQEMGAIGRSQMLMLDLQYAEVGGLFERLEKAGAVDRLEDFVPKKAMAKGASEFLPREQARAVLVRRFGRHLASVDWDHALGRDEAGGLWFIPMDDPLDGHELLSVVTSAEDWDSCLRQLIRMDLARGVAVCAVVCEGRPISPARPEKMVLT